MILNQQAFDNGFQLFDQRSGYFFLIGSGEHQRRGRFRKQVFRIIGQLFLKIFIGSFGSFQVVDPISCCTKIHFLFSQFGVYGFQFLGAFFLLVLDNAQVLFMSALVFPFDPMPLHGLGKSNLFRSHPLIPFRV